jgi:nucleotide-binding universal stress UspA family protein
MSQAAPHRPPRPAQHPAPEDREGLREILFASDLTPESDRSFGHARMLAERFRAHVTLFHAVRAPRVKQTIVDDEVWRRQELAARAHLALGAETLAVTPTVVVKRSDSVARSLVALIRQTRPDLVVMRTHGRRGFAHAVLGSVAERVVEAAQHPLLCIRQPDHAVALPYRRILVPTDLTLSSRRAFPLAATLARGFGAEVMALHVVPLARAPRLDGVPELVEARVPSEWAVREYMLPECSGLPVSARVELGAPWETILRTARNENADLIVLSTHGENSLADRVLGSHAQQILRQAHCPVLVT